jgi:hypothetical protein
LINSILAILAIMAILAIHRRDTHSAFVFWSRRSLRTAAAGRRRRVPVMGTPAFVSIVPFVFFVMNAVGSSQRDSERR